MALRWEQVAVDARDAGAIGHWWAQALEWQVVDEGDDWIELRGPAAPHPTLFFGNVSEGKTVKNRLHLDLVPDDQAAEVERLISLGATHVDIGQGEQSWVVLADPEGNEFCVLSART